MSHAINESREILQQRLLLGDCQDIEGLHPLQRPYTNKSSLERVLDPPACIEHEPVVFKLPGIKNSDVFVVGEDEHRQLVKIRGEEIVETREYIDGFTLDGVLLTQKDIGLAVGAIEAFHKQATSGALPLQERMPWAPEQTLQQIMALPGPVVNCHLDPTLANVLMTPDCSAATLIDDEYQALAPAVFDFGIFVAKLKRQHGVILPATLLDSLLPNVTGLQQAAKLAHQLWLESKTLETAMPGKCK